jgi:stage III sporulation protein AH
MKILKRNQLIILVISLMLVTAGYLNFTSTNAQDNTKETVAELGDATLVNSNKIENENVVENSVEQETPKEEKTEEEEVVKPTNAETTPKEDTYFTTSKLERENIYSQMLETYQEIYNNANSTQEQKEKAIGEIAKINERRNAIMIAENLILAKGIENVVIFANENSVSVIAKAETLEPEKIAQIQNIVSRELEVGAEIISISTK